MKLKEKRTGGNMLDWEDAYFNSQNGTEEQAKVGTFNSSAKPIAAAISAGWFKDVDRESDPMTIIRAADSDELIDVAAQILTIYQAYKLDQDGDPN